MATKTFEELKQMAIQIRDEKTNKQNTATRIGTQMLEHLNKLEQDFLDKDTTEGKFSELEESTNTKFSELEENTNTKFSELETLSNLQQLYTFNRVQYTEQDGYLNASGQYQDTAFKSKTTVQYYCNPGDIFLYKGKGVENAVSVLYMTNDTIVDYSIYDSPSNYVEITIPSGVNSVQFSSFKANSVSDDIILDVICKETSIFTHIDGTKLKEGSVDGSKFNKNLKFFQLHTRKGMYIHKDGVILKYTTDEVGPSAQGITPLLRLYANINLQITNHWKGEGLGSDVAFFDSNYKLIGVSNDFGFNSGTISINTDDLISVAPAGSIFFALNVSYGYSTLICDVDLSDYSDFILSKNFYDFYDAYSNNSVDVGIDLIISGVDFTEQNGYLASSGKYGDASNFKSKTSIKYRCKKGYKYLYKGMGTINAVSWIFYYNNTIVSTGQANSTLKYTEVVIPEGVNGVVFSSYNTISSDVVFDVKYKIEDSVDSIGNVLYGEKWYCCGDSYSEGDFTNSPNPENTRFTDGIYAGLYKVYSRFIALRNTMDLQLLAKCGATCGAWKEDVDAGTVETPTNTNTFYYNQLPQILANEDENFKGYITLWFCINDGSRCTLGTINDETVDTFYGALNWCAIQLITNFPLAKIGFIVSNNAKSSYQQAVREVAQKWAIPYLDMEGDAQVPTISGKRTNQDIPVDPRVITLRWNNNFRVSSANGHPNEKAHEYQSTFIENWLRSL